MAVTPINGIAASIAYWLLMALLPLLHTTLRPWHKQLYFWLSTLGCLNLVFFALAGFAHHPAETVVLPLGLPDFPLLIRSDNLSCVFLTMLGLVATGIGVHASAYFSSWDNKEFKTVFVFYHFFLAGMTSVLIANDGYGFLIAWEVMALSSYFLVNFYHEDPDSRKAGFVYLIVAHVGAIGLLLAFGLMQQGAGDFSFDLIRATTLDPVWKQVAFFLALTAFAIKAGIVPFHVWLPLAHPAAPSPISAMMSSIMVSTAVYGLLRIGFDLLNGGFSAGIGLFLLAIGLFSAFYGVIFAIVQTDMKRLLAYSTIENMGLIFAMVGLVMIFMAFGKDNLATIALVALLMHCVSHACFKSLLFLSTGNVLHATGERNLGKLGGLIRTMPRVAVLTLIGTIGMAGLPPLNGFISEWLMLQSFLAFVDLPQSALTLVLPLCAALFILVAGLAGYLSVKFFGIIFLGQPRESKLANAHDPSWSEIGALGYLALGCILIGIFPDSIIQPLKIVAMQLLHKMQIIPVFEETAWFIIPISEAQSSYSPILYLLFISLFVGLAFVCVRVLFGATLRRSDPWACGLKQITPRMQDTSEGFGQPIKKIFGAFMIVRRESHHTHKDADYYDVSIHDRVWDYAYMPLTIWVKKIAAVVAKLQHGRINGYLVVSFLTLIVLLVMVTWL